MPEEGEGLLLEMVPPMENAVSLEQQIGFVRHELERAKVRFGRWLVVCSAFAAGVSVIAVLAKSIPFFVVAGFGWFFVWNRWKCRAFVSALSSKSMPFSDAERAQWVASITNAILHPPSWWNRSENISGVALIALFAVITYVVVSISGWWMRVLYAAAWGALILHVVLRVKDGRAITKNASNL